MLLEPGLENSELILLVCAAAAAAAASVVSGSVRPRGLQPTRLRHPRDFLGKSTGVGSLSLHQGIVSTQGLDSGLPHYRQFLYQLSHKGSPC